MYVVIFKATAKQQNQLYLDTVEKMRSLAFKKYNCVDFVALTEGKQEIALSYWHKQEDIVAWRNDAEHLLAQQHGKTKWYSEYSVEVAKIERQYSN
ncbi:antibiotic biosynthesis monooxygenase family protein [Glaciecola petra]|uniref:Antibiotic biosynthesis monooxygenase n=1 Tax=Glaciecola petra TaxID=3075602 RepID=A0ABU2ZTZ8_9ALTE|nr:antibiotic biosynthesis monooxygenase [Aestuariibacter sp. P117]MDT0596117.1 antibiotic biosynthesis monooxygenase [Aestuariibacter sp. P117]